MPADQEKHEKKIRDEIVASSMKSNELRPGSKRLQKLVSLFRLKVRNF